MNAAQAYHLITPDDLSWRPSNLMKIPNADYLERTGSENLGARLWRLPPGSANTLHKHVRAEEFYFVLDGVGRMRVNDETVTVPQFGAVLVRPESLRQVFNDTEADVLWLIIGAPEETEYLPGATTPPDMSLIYPVDPKQLPPELAGTTWPPLDTPQPALPTMNPVDFEAHAREWIAAWNAHDLERILSHYSEDVELTSPFATRLTDSGDGVVRGHEALRGYFARALAAYPDLGFEFYRLYPGVRTCVLEYRSVNNLRAAETLEFNPAGKVCRVLAHYTTD